MCVRRPIIKEDINEHIERVYTAIRIQFNLMQFMGKCFRQCLVVNDHYFEHQIVSIES